MRRRLIDREALIDAISKQKLLAREPAAKRIIEIIKGQTVYVSPDRPEFISRLKSCHVTRFEGTLPDGRICHFSDVIEYAEKGYVE